ncbi:hypothetical protein BGL72_06675 [Helicobacter pylori]|nr:hypothetical protein BGL72_06675 [Helicobacter pylori]
MDTQNLTFFQKIGFLNLIFIVKTHFLKGIGGILKQFPLQPPLNNPLTQEDRFFLKSYRLLTQALCH